MKIAILIIAFLVFTGCDKEDDVPRVKTDDVCLEITSTEPYVVTGYIGQSYVTSSTCVRVSPGDRALIELWPTGEKSLFTIHMYRNGKLIAYKANHCVYDYYRMTYQF